MKQRPLSWIDYGRKFIGLKEIKGPKHNGIILGWLSDLKAWWKDDETPWCGTYIAHCLKEQGIEVPTHWYRALDYMNKGTLLPGPAYGCVAIKGRKGGGHVTFIVGITPTGKLVGMGGNQNDMVCYATFNKSDFDQFRWYGTQKLPLKERYELPVITNVTSSKVTES